MTPNEHFAWCKTRALEYLDSGDLVNAVASFSSDLLKNDVVTPNAAIAEHFVTGTKILLHAKGDVARAVRSWIDDTATLLGITP